MTYFKYLFSDKKALPYWLAMFILAILFSPVGLIQEITTGVSGIAIFLRILMYPAIEGILFIGFYSSGYLNYKKQQRFKQRVEGPLRLGIFSMASVEVFQDNFSITGIKTNYSASFEVKPWKAEFECLETNEAIIILPYVFDLGMFKRHIKPLVINKMEENCKAFRKAIYPEVMELTKKEGRTTALFYKSVETIKQIVVVNR